MGQHGEHRPLVRVVAALTLGLWAPMAQAVECRLALVLALDVSSSVDAAEDALQRKGLAAALIAPKVQDAFFAADLPVALAVYEWSGRNQQVMVLDWQMIRGPEDLLSAAQTVGRSTRSHADFPTAMGYALGFGEGLFRRGPACLFSTLDMAGDGENNEGFAPSDAYNAFDFSAITVNGLVVNAAEYEAEVSLIDYYRREVIHGPGAFIEVAQGFEDYERAMRAKLLRELTPRQIGARPVSRATGAPG